MINRYVLVAVMILTGAAGFAGYRSDCFTLDVSTRAAVTNAWDLPPLVLDDLNGKQRKLYDWHGRVIILNFWASWCGPCLTEIPSLVRYQQEYGEAGLQIIGVAMDEAQKARNVVRSLYINYPVLVADPDDNQGLLGHWGDARQVLPYSVVIGRDGHIHFTRIGVMDEESFTDYVLPLIMSTPTRVDITAASFQ